MLAAPARCWGAGRPAFSVLARRWCAAPGAQLSLAPSGELAPIAAATTALRPVGPGALQPAEEASVPAVPSAPARVKDIVYKGPLAEDLGGAARHATTVARFWSNIPVHVRASFEAPSSLEEAPKSVSPTALDGLLTRAKELVASTGLGPPHWSTRALMSYYGGRIPLAPYKRGQTAAYNYSSVLVPRELAHRFPLDMYVDPVFATSDPAQRLRMRGTTLFPRLQGKLTLLLIFSGQPLSGLWTGLRRWLQGVGDEFLQREGTQLIRLHCEEGWLNRRTHQLTKFQLRRQVEEDELFTTFVYRGKWKHEYVRSLHLYDKQLPVVLLLDTLGYVRWHAVGLPSVDAETVFRQLSQRLAQEKKTHA